MVIRENRPRRLTRSQLTAHPLGPGPRDPDRDDPARPATRGWLAAPLIAAGGANLGLVRLSDREGGDFTADDEAVLVQLAETAAASLERLTALRRQTTVSTAPQRALLGPADLPPGFGAHYEPRADGMEAGGDWYDVVPLPGGRYGMVVGDVVGHGLPATAAMGQLRSAARALLLQDHGPGEVLAALDTFAALIPDAYRCTVLCAVVDQEAGTVRYASAGHPPAILDSGDGSGPEYLEGAQSTPLAAVEGSARPEALVGLPPGSTLLLYTDGRWNGSG